MNVLFSSCVSLLLVVVISIYSANAEVSGRVADCPKGYTNIGLLCSRGADTYSNPSKVADCPSGYTNMGLTCYKPPFTSRGLSSMSCKDGWFRTGGRCYKNCKNGYTSVGEACMRGVSTLTSGNMTCKPHEVLNKEIGRCYIPQEPGESCWADAPCGNGFKCQPIAQRCVPEDLPLSSNQMCSAFKVDDLVEAAKNANTTMSYGGGSVSSAGGAYSQEIGTVYGQGGEFGCYVSACTGGVSDLSIANFANFGIFEEFSNVSGLAIVSSQGASVPIIEAGFTTAQVLTTNGQLIGSLNSLSIGVGVSPIQVGVMSCYTEVIDGNRGIAELRDSVDKAEVKAKNLQEDRATVKAATEAIVLSDNYLKIQNRWKQDQFLNNQNGPLSASVVKPNWHSARWIIEPVIGTQYIRIKNYWKQDLYIHNQYGRAAVGKIKTGWWSAQWQIENVPNSFYVRLKNRWKSDQYLNIQNGKIESGEIKPGWWSAMWLIK